MTSYIMQAQKKHVPGLGAMWGFVVNMPSGHCFCENGELLQQNNVL